ncbi:MAG: hypothetical protein AAFY56_17515 [Pseudomonadota bacterium]
MVPDDKELIRRIDEIVHYVRDPIGISGSPHARDEYNSYLTALFGRVKAGDVDAIIDYVKWVAVAQMGLNFDEGKARKAAERMPEWKDFIENPV